MSGKKKFRAPTAAPASTASNAATPLESVESFSFGDPIAVNDRASLMECLECHNNGRWYEPPISPYGLARMFDVAATRY